MMASPEPVTKGSVACPKRRGATPRLRRISRYLEIMSYYRFGIAANLKHIIHYLGIKSLDEQILFFHIIFSGTSHFSIGHKKSPVQKWTGLE
jgi:exosortase/archaeosortase